MKQTGIIFQSDMIRALQNTKPGVWPAEPIDPNRPFKFMTRRVIRPQPDLQHGCVEGVFVGDARYALSWSTVSNLERFAMSVQGEHEKVKETMRLSYCRYGQPGDQLWTRETWAPKSIGSNGKPEQNQGFWYRSDGERISWGYAADNKIHASIQIWRPSIFQPRWASRFTLEIKEIRVERVSQISEADAKAEGVWALNEPYQGVGDLPTDRFQRLWQSIHGNKHPWDTTWVWVISFMVLPK